MLLMLRLVAIVAFIFAANLNLYSQQDTSLWQQSGNVWIHKQNIGSIRQSGLSSTGDSLWTFSDDNGYFFRIWDLKSGMIVYEKIIPSKPYRWPSISTDMQAVIYMINPAEFEIYDLQTDTLIKAYELYDISREKVAPEVSVDYNALRREVYYAQKRGMISRGISHSSMSMQVYVINEGVQAGASFGPNFIYNIDLSCIAGIGNSHSDKTYDNTEYSHNVSFYSLFPRSSGSLYSIKWNNSEKYRMYNRIVFTSKPNLLAGIDSESNLTIWDWKLRTTISHSKLRNFNFGSICFTEDDEFIAGTRNNKIFLYDLESKNIIDSTDIPNPYTKLLYSKSNSFIVFTTGSRFGIYDSKLLSTEPYVEFITDSNLVYTGQPVKLYNKSNIDYDAIEWELSDGRKSFHPNPTLIFDTPGMIDVTLRLTKDGKIYSIKKEDYIEIYTLLKPDFEVDLEFGDAPLTVQFENKSQGIITEYVWKANNVEFSQEKNPQFTSNEPGEYDISLTVTDKYNTFTTVKKSFIRAKRAGTKLLETAKYANFNFLNVVYHPDAHVVGITPSGTVVFKDKIIIPLGLSTYRNYGGAVREGAVSILEIDTALNHLNTIVMEELAHYFSCSNIIVIDSSLFYSFIPHGYSTRLRKIHLVENISIKIDKHFSNYMPGPLRLVNLNDSNYIFGGIDYSKKSIIFNMDKEINPVAADTLEFQLIDLIHYSKEYAFALTIDTMSKYYYYTLIPSDFENQTNYKVEIPEGIKVNCILKIPNDLIAFGGTIGKDSVGVLGVTDMYGKLIWMKTFPYWRKFDRLFQNRNNFFATGVNTDNQIGFIESNSNGTEFSDNRKITPKIPFVFSVIQWNDNTVLLSTSFGNDANVEVSKYSYTPLGQTPDSVDTTATPGGIAQILPVPNPAENTVTLQFAEAYVVQKVQVYDYSGIEVMQFTYPQSPLYEVTLPIQALSIGMYHVTVTTDSGILRTKFIKY